MKIYVKTYGLLGELVKKPVPREVFIERPFPLTVRKILREVGIEEQDFSWIAVTVNGVLIHENEFDIPIERDTVQVAVYPVFAGG
jgi:sulfur carrier protein ThiS